MHADTFIYLILFIYIIILQPANQKDTNLCNKLQLRTLYTENIINIYFCNNAYMQN